MNDTTRWVWLSELGAASVFITLALVLVAPVLADDADYPIFKLFCDSIGQLNNQVLKSPSPGNLSRDIHHQGRCIYHISIACGHDPAALL
jgi:hypothetical protein